MSRNPGVPQEVCYGCGSRRRALFSGYDFNGNIRLQEMTRWNDLRDMTRDKEPESY
jgi:hypothetical protein